MTALYEIVPAIESANKQLPSFTIDFRYKKPDEDVSQEISLDIYGQNNGFEQSSENMRFAASAAGLGLLLGKSQYLGELTYQNVIEWSTNASSYDPYGLRGKFVQLATKAASMAN